MKTTVGLGLAVLVLLPAVLAGQHQRLVETRLEIDDHAGSNGGPTRTTGYFDVRTRGNVCKHFLPLIVVVKVLTRSHAIMCRSTRGACSSGSSRLRRRGRKSSLLSYG